LFTGVFIGGMMLAVIIASYLKSSGNADAQQSNAKGRGFSKVAVYMLASFILLLPLLLLKFEDATENVLAEKIGELTGVCLAPAIITGLWMRFSKEQWSWLEVGLKYILIFLIFALSVMMKLLSDK
jgi:phosphatidylglycerophosphate synthase